MKNKKIVIFGFMAMLFMALLGNKSALAYNTIEQKTLASAIRKCYSSSPAVMVSSINLKDFVDYQSVVGDSSSDFVPLPTGFSSLHKIDNNNLSCRQLFGGYNYNAVIDRIGEAISADGHATLSFGGGSFSGLFRNANVDGAPTSEAGKRALLEKLGYTPRVESSNGKCLSFNLKYSEPTNPNLAESIRQSAQLCTGDGTVAVDKISINNAETAQGYATGPIVYSLLDGGVLQLSMVRTDNGYDFKTFNLNNYSNFDALVRDLREEINNHFGSGITTDMVNGIRRRYAPSNSTVEGKRFVEYVGTEDSRSVTYELTGTQYKVANNLLGTNYSNGTDLQFSPDEMFQLYNRYLVDYYGINVTDGVICSASETYDVMHNDRGYEQGPRLVDGDIRVCYIKASKNQDKKVYGLSSQRFFDGTTKTWQELLSDLMSVRNSLTVAGMAGGEANADNTAVAPTPSGESGASATSNGEFCKKAGLKSQGWLFCPALENMEYTATAMDNIIQSWLEIDTDFYAATNSNGETTGTYVAWEMMRNTANVLMVILFLVIIFSQLTGVGIDNYGIKKMLPRLVVMAILINLSFYLCEIAVDLSNIVGAGLRDLFGGMGNLVASNTSQSGIENFIGTVITALFASAGIAGAAAAVAIPYLPLAFSGGAVMAVVAVILALLVILVAVLLFFLMLGLRLILVIICIVLSPVAFASYILPNTQSFFKKWWELFKAVLIVFPVCGFLGGASYLIKKIVLSIPEPHFLLLMIALVAPFLPFFLLPTLLKNAIAATGKIGGALTSMGNAFRNGISSGRQAIQNTDTFKARAQEGSNRILRWKVGMGENNQLTKKGVARAQRAREKGGAAQRLYAAQLAAVEKASAQNEDDVSKLLGAEARTEILNTSMGYTDSNGNDVAMNWGDNFKDKTREAYYARQFLTAAHANGGNGDVNAMNAAIAAAKAGGMKDKFIAQMMRKAIEQGHLDGMHENTRMAWAQDMAARYGRDFMGTDMKFSDWMAKGATGGKAGLASHKVDKNDIKPEDASKMSSDSIAEMLVDGSIDQSMAREMLAKNPNLAPDKKLMVASIASGAVKVTDVQSMGAAKFKEDVKALSNDHTSNVWHQFGVGEELVDAWTAPTPQDVNVVQNFQSGGSQVDDVNARLRQAHHGGQPQNGTGGQPPATI